jgi:hypothetical protein
MFAWPEAMQSLAQRAPHRAGPLLKERHMAAGNRPTQEQMKLLRRLAAERGQTFAYPSTGREASREIRRLLKTKRSHRSDVAADRAAVDREAREALDGAIVRPEEIQGYGSSASWRRAS